MRFPELIFGFITIGLIGFLIWSLRVYKRKKNLKKLMLKILISILIIGFSWIWFVPIYIGQNGESPVCKFRFQVFVYETHDYYGHGDFRDLLIRPIPVKYGSRDFHRKTSFSFSELQRCFWTRNLQASTKNSTNN